MIEDEPVQESAPVEPQLTVEDLGLTEAASIAKNVGLNLVQYVEVTRDGGPWCSLADAEEMLVKTAQASMRGMAGVKASTYAISYDAATKLMTLRLGQ